MDVRESVDLLPGQVRSRHPRIAEFRIPGEVVGGRQHTIDEEAGGADIGEAGDDELETRRH